MNSLEAVFVFSFFFFLFFLLCLCFLAALICVLWSAYMRHLWKPETFSSHVPALTYDPILDRSVGVVIAVRVSGIAFSSLFVHS